MRNLHEEYTQARQEQVDAWMGMIKKNPSLLPAFLDWCSDQGHLDEYHELYLEPLQWEGDHPPEKINKVTAETMYRERADRWAQIESFNGHKKLREVFQHDTPCHICGSENTVEGGSEVNDKGMKVCYVACHDCEMVIGDCS